jgi:Ca-activated chloride channel family protein
VTAVTPSSQSLQFGFLGYAARFAEPRALWLLLLVLLVAAVGVWSLWRRRRLLEGAAGQLAHRIAPEANLVRPAARLSLQTAGLALLLIGLAGPQCGTHSELTKRYGVDLVVALDASRSMLARDLPPDRLSRAKLELSALLDKLAGDRVAVVVFAEEAFVQCPLTTDYAAAKLFLRSVSTDSVPQQGTSLENALHASRDVLAAAERGARSKAVLLLTDGEDHEQGALEAADDLATDGIRVFAVGIGSPGGAPIPELDKQGNVTGYKTDAGGETILTKLDESLLREIADRTKGRYVRGGAGDFGLAQVKAELDRMEKSELEGRITTSYEERYAYAAFPGFLLLLAGFLLREGRPRREERPAPVVPEDVE